MIKIEGIILRKTDEPDAHGDTFNFDGIEMLDKVDVTHEFKHGLENIIGRAELTKTEKGIYAKIKLFKNHPKVKDIEKTCRALAKGGIEKSIIYGYIGGKITKRENDNIIKECKVDYIAIGIDKNADPNIPPLNITVSAEEDKD